MIKAYSLSTGRILGWVAWFLFLVGSAACAPAPGGSQAPQGTPGASPPTAIIPASDLQIPATPALAPISGTAALPEDISQGFALDVNGIIVTDEWNVTGRVEAVEPGLLIITTEQGDTARLAYRLPGSLFLALNLDEPVQLVRTTDVVGASLEYELAITSQDRLVLASSRVYSERPLEIKVVNEITLEQMVEQGKELGSNQYEVTYQIPVNVSFAGRQETIALNEGFEMDVEDQKMTLFVTTSQQTVPQKGYEGVVEGSGFILEYFLVSR